MEDRKIRVAITHGDTNGIGYELIFKTFSEPDMLELCTPVIYGSPKVASYHRKALNMQANFSIISHAEEIRDGRVNMLTTFDDDVKVDLGTPTDESSIAASKALQRAANDFQAGLFDVLVTAPAIKNGQQGFEGNEAYVRKNLSNGSEMLPIILNENIRVGLLTDEIPLSEVSMFVTKENIVDKAAILFNSLKRDFMITNPRIAILALNPDSNDNQTFGKEEQEAIKPAVEELSDKGIEAFGPYAADTFFANGYHGEFDGILAMYHDQGMAPFTALYPTDGVIYYAGLPVVCATPNDDAGFGIAGQGIADETSLRHAIYTAIDVFRNRDIYDEPLANPLQKLYHEKRDDSEKVRFTIPKKHENSIKETKDGKVSTHPSSKKDASQKRPDKQTASQQPSQPVTPAQVATAEPAAQVPETPEQTQPQSDNQPS